MNKQSLVIYSVTPQWHLAMKSIKIK